MMNCRKMISGLPYKRLVAMIAVSAIVPVFFLAPVYAAPDNNEPKPVYPAMKTQVDKNCPLGQCIITKYVQPVFNMVTALVGIGVTFSIIYGGIEIEMAAGNPQKVASGRQRISTAIFVLLGYFVFLAFLNWMVPGGVKPLKV